ncbi:hypothetical protein N4P33_01500 [Streptomyces sp. 15-116A]|uniref:hypothetical protein n=1 Tax=Streptomyces sp. 15-116A TaxID=2259035 RepID=UPI0021B31A3A|nr:hypothetical protein [Streptomyces sp. 15-116A]MCT7350858.1 hypothetical protein [Streptomyces sp. 15-116A]
MQHHVRWHRRWGTPVAANLILGVAAIVPLWLTAMFVLSHLWALTPRDPTDNDGTLPWLIVLTLLWSVFLALWLPVNAYARPRTGVSALRYWSISTGLALTPMAFLSTLFALVEG